jgi:hypothetical protein
MFQQAEDGTFTSTIEETIDLTEYDVKYGRTGGDAVNEERLAQLHAFFASKGFVRDEVDAGEVAAADTVAKVEEAEAVDDEMEQARAKAKAKADAVHAARKSAALPPRTTSIRTDAAASGPKTEL